MTTEAGTPTELEAARERLARSRVQIQQHFLPGGEGPPGTLPLLRGLAVKGVRALISGPGTGGNGLQVGLAVAGLLLMFLTRRRSRGLGLMISLAIALMRFSRRR